jgi:hypothetical protein
MLEDWILCSCDCNGNIYVKAQFAHYLATSAFCDHAKVFCQFSHLAAPSTFSYHARAFGQYAHLSASTALIMPKPFGYWVILQLPHLMHVGTMWVIRSSCSFCISDHVKTFLSICTSCSSFISDHAKTFLSICSSSCSFCFYDHAKAFLSI